MNPQTNDPLAHASEMPDISALIKEAESAQHNQLCNLSRIKTAEAERYQARDGKDGSGQLWQKNVRDRSKIVRPWDGCPDPDASLTDEIIENEVDLWLLAYCMGVLGGETSGLSQLTGAQLGELKAVARYCQRAIAGDLADGLELLAQMTATLGSSIVMTGWKETYELVERTVDLEGLATEAAQYVGPEMAQQFYVSILDPLLEAPAVAAILQAYPYLPKNRAKQVVKDLREQGTAQFLDRAQCEKRPFVEVLIPGYNYFVSGSAGDIREARLHLRIRRFTQAQFESLAADRGWNEAWVQRAIATAGTYSAFSDAMKQKEERADLGGQDLTIEVWETDVLQFDPETNAGGIYCTVFSPHVKPDGSAHRADATGTTEADFGEHFLCDYAHRLPRFILARREVNGPGMFDSRGVPDITQPNSQAIRNLQKAELARAHIEVDPPRAFQGGGWSKQDTGLAPGARIESLFPNATVQDLSPTKGSPQVAEQAMERLQRDTARLFAFPDQEVHPARWQPRALRKSKRAAMPWEQVLTQLVVLCYQNFNEEELAQILGKFPTLKVEDVLAHRITLTFDPRGLDGEWRKQTLDTMMQLLQLDKGGLMDTGLMIQLIGNYTDPSLMSAIIRDPAGASAAMYRKVSNDILDIMAGNPPPMVEMDATAGMQLKMAMQVIGQNERYQQILQQDEKIAENLKTYVKNLQHSEQETQLSPQQGRLGVTAMPQRPVQVGSPQLGS